MIIYEKITRELEATIENLHFLLKNAYHTDLDVCIELSPQIRGNNVELIFCSKLGHYLLSFLIGPECIEVIKDSFIDDPDKCKELPSIKEKEDALHWFSNWRKMMLLVQNSNYYDYDGDGINPCFYGI